jgi:DNA repair exonuclease SbcCD nuclease subunit
MSKWLVTADLHFTNRHSKFKLDRDGISDLLKAQRDFIFWIADMLEAEDYDGFILAGDVTDYPTMDPITLTAFNACMKRLFKTGKKIIILEGNHCISDQGNLYTVVGATKELTLCDNAYMLTQREVLRFDDVTFYCCPYSSDSEEIESEIARWNESADRQNNDVLLFHFPTINAVLDNGLASKNGVNLSKDIVSNFTVCLGGDFHKPQQLVNTDNAYYVGAPFDLKFGQIGPRVVTSITIENGGYKMEQIPNPYNFPMIYIKEDEVESLLATDLSRTIARMTETPSDNSISVILEENRKKFYSVHLPSVSKVRRERPKSANVLSGFGRSRDKDIIGVQLDNIGIDNELKTVAINIFQKISEKE